MGTHPSATPTFSHTLHHVQHMTGVLLQQRGRIVAVVGLAHLDGIERRWDAAQQASAGGKALLVAAQNA